MKKMILAIAMLGAVSAQAQYGGNPAVGIPTTYPGDDATSVQDTQLIMTSANLKAYLKKNKLGSVEAIEKSWNLSKGTVYTLTTSADGCAFQVVIRKNLNPAVRPVADSLVCEAH